MINTIPIDSDTARRFIEAFPGEWSESMAHDAIISTEPSHTGREVENDSYYGNGYLVCESIDPERRQAAIDLHNHIKKVFDEQNGPAT